MAITLEELQVIIDAKIGPFTKKMKQIENQTQASMSKVKSAVSGLAKLFAGLFIGAKLLELGKYSTQMALEINAAMNQVKRTMGESTDAFLKWVNNNANAMNMSTGDALKYASTYSNLFSGFIKDSQKLSAYTAKMLKTSAIIAQGTGRNITDVNERIRSGLLGSTEAIEDLGINVNVAMIESTNAFRKFANGQHWQDLDFQTQQQIRLMAILEQASAKYGDTLEGSVNNSVALFQALMRDSALNIGNAFLPVLEAIMPVINSIADLFKRATAKVAEFVQLLFGKKVSVKDSAMGAAASGAHSAANDVGDMADAMDDAAGGAGDAAEGMDKTGKAAKKAVKELLGLAGFDEITALKIDEPDEDDSGGADGRSPKGGGGRGKGRPGGSPKDILPELAFEDVDNGFKNIFDGLGDKLKGLFDFIDKLWSKFKEGFNLTFRADGIDRVKKALDGIWESIKDIFDDGKVAEAAVGFLEKLAFALGQVVGGVTNVILGIAVFIAESLNKSLQETHLDIKNWLIREFDILGDLTSHIGNIAQDISQIFYDVITSEPATNIEADLLSAWQYSFMGASELVSKVGRDITGGISKIIRDNKEEVTTALTGLLSAAEPIFNSFKELIKNTFKKMNEVYDEHVAPFVASVTDGISKIFNTLLKGWNEHIQPVFDNVGKRVKELYEEHIQPTVDSLLDLVGKIADLLKILWERNLLPLFNWIAANILPILAPIGETIAEVFIIGIGGLMDTLKVFLDFLGGFIDFIVGGFTGDWERAWTGVKEMFSAVWDAIKIIPETILKEMESEWSHIVPFFKAIWEAVKSSIELVWNNLITSFSNVWKMIKDIFSDVDSWFDEKFSKAWENIKNAFSKMSSWFGEQWNAVKNNLASVNNWFSEKFSSAWQAVTAVFNVMGNWFAMRWQEVQSVLDGVSSWFSDTFNNAWQGIVDAFSNVTGFFTGIFNDIVSLFSDIGGAVGDAISSAFTQAVNVVMATVEGIINGVVDVINSILSHIPGVGYRVDHVPLPRLARGGIVDSPTIAMIGEAGKEAVVPLENTGFLQTMARIVGGAVNEAVGGNNRGSNLADGDIIIQIGGSELGRIAIREINAEQERAGQTLLKI